MTEFIRNEAAVREEIIAPILAALDYRSNGKNPIRHELSLRYPNDFLGRKKPATDPPLRGRADYVCYAGDRVAWTLEAKAEGEQITQDAIEQAYSYARHPEVRAVYFCLCNGIEFQVYMTDAAPGQPPRLTVDPRNFEVAVKALRAIVGADELQSRFAHQAASTIPPLGPGLSSFAQIIQGCIIHEHQTPEIPGMRGFTVSIHNGTVERLETGLLARIEGRAPYSSMQRLIERLGLTTIELTSASTDLSGDPENPTVFQAQMAASFPKGETMLNLTTHNEIELPFTMYCRMTIRAHVTLTGTVVAGAFQQDMRYSASPEADAVPLMLATSAGTVELHLR